MSKEKNKNKNHHTSKKISFFAAILVVIGSSIGAGIFFKAGNVLDSVQNSLIMAIFCWIIAAISVVAMAFALVEVASTKNDNNLSVIGWSKVFNGKINYKACKNFMYFVYLPMNYFFMPAYVLFSLQDGIRALINKDAVFSTSVDWLLWMIIGLGILLYFAFVSGFSTRAGNIHNKVITSIKFIPLVVVAIIGFVLVVMNAGGQINIGFVEPTGSIEKGTSIIKFAPVLGMFIAISAIFFTYDGFYFAAGIQSEMKEPHKTPLATLLGLVITTVIYLIVAISISINGGSFTNMLVYMQNQWNDAGRIIFGIINIMIAIGIMGIINGLAMWVPRLTEDLIAEDELPFSSKFKDKLNHEKPKVGILYSISIVVPIVILFTIIGSLAYIDTGDYGSKYGQGMDKFYSFADLMATWSALFTFGFIALAIAGCLGNRKTKRIRTEQKKYFIPMAWISLIMISISIIATIVEPIVNLCLIYKVDKSLSNYDEILISRIMLVVVLFIFGMFSYGQAFLEQRKILFNKGLRFMNKSRF